MYDVSICAFITSVWISVSCGIGGARLSFFRRGRGLSALSPFGVCYSITYHLQRGLQQGLPLSSSFVSLILPSPFANFDRYIRIVVSGYLSCPKVSRTDEMISSVNIAAPIATLRSAECSTPLGNTALLDLRIDLIRLSIP